MKRKVTGSMISINNCRRVLFKNFNVDWNWDKDPLASLVKVKQVGKSGSYADFIFLHYHAFPRKNIRVADIHQIDQDSMSVGCEDGKKASFEVFPSRDLSAKVKWLSDNLLRVYSDPYNRYTSHNNFRDFKEGTLYLMRHYGYDMCSLMVQNNEHVTLLDINIYSCPGKAIWAQRDQKHWQLLNVNVKKPPYAMERPITSTADGFHVAQSQGYLKIEGCEFGFCGDDCINVHDSSAFGIKTGPRTLTIPKLTISAALGIHIGDQIELRNDDFSPAFFTAEISEIKYPPAGSRKYSLVFEKNLPEPKGSGFVVFNHRYGSSNIIIRNNFFHDNRARGILLMSNNITVENNRFFHTERAAVMLVTGYAKFWAEGYGASNIIIRNNNFSRINPIADREMAPAIYISPFIGTDPSTQKTKFPLFNDILIESNIFHNCMGGIAYICSAKNVIFCCNTITNTIKRKINFLYRGALGTELSSGVYLTKNKWIESPLVPNPGLFYDPNTSTDVYCWENQIKCGKNSDCKP